MEGFAGTGNRWISPDTAPTSTSVVGFFLVYTHDLNSGQIDSLRNIVATQSFTTNTISQEKLIEIREQVVDAVVLHDNHEIHHDLANEIAPLFFTDVDVPLVITSFDKDNGRRSLVRCFKEPELGNQNEIKVFEEACSKYSLPLWHLSIAKPGMPVECSPPSYLLDVVTSDNIFSKQVAEQFDRSHSWMLSVCQTFPYSKNDIEPDSASGKQSHIEDVSMSENRMETSLEQSSSRDQEPICTTGSIGEDLSYIKASVSTILHMMSDVHIPHLKKVEVENEVRKFGYARHGYLDDENKHLLNKLCTEYFTGIRNKLRICSTFADEFYRFVSVFSDKNDVRLSKVRCSICYHTHPLPAMDCVLSSTSDELRKSSDDLSSSSDVVMTDDENPAMQYSEGHSDEDLSEEEWSFDLDDAFSETNSYSGSREEQMDWSDADDGGNEDHMSKKLRRSINDFKLARMEGFEKQGELLSKLSTIHTRQSVEKIQSRSSHLNSPQGLCISHYTPDIKGFHALKKVLQRHETTFLHGNHVEKADREVSQYTTETDGSEKELVFTATFATTVYEVLRSGISIREVPRLLTMQLINGAKVGSSHYSRRSASAMAFAISDELHNALCTRIMKPDSQFSLLVDGSEDRSQMRVMSVQIRLLIDNWPTILHWSIVDKAEGDAGSHYMIGVLISLEQSVRRLNLALSQPFATTFANNLLTASTDGASAMRSTFWRYLSQFRNDFSSVPSPSLPFTWCRAHLLEIAIKDFSKNDETVQLAISVVRLLHRLFHTASYSKTQRVWNSASTILNGRKIVFGKFFDVRWCPSLQALLETTMEQYGAILRTLKFDILAGKRNPAKSADFTEKVKLQAFALYHILSDVRVYLRFNALLNVLTTFTTASKILQQEALLMCEAEMTVDSAFHKLDKYFNHLMDNNLRKRGGGTYYGFACKNKLDGRISPCKRQFIDNVFTPETWEKLEEEIFGYDAVLVLNDKQSEQTRNKILPGLTKDGVLFKLRKPDDFEEDWTIETVGQDETRILRSMRDKGKKTTIEPDDYYKLLSSFFTTDDSVESVNTIPILQRYFSMSWPIHEVFKRNFNEEIQSVMKRKFGNDDILQKNYYAVSPDLIIDALSCMHTVHIHLAKTCTWALKSDKEEVEIRNFPFYMEYDGRYDFEERYEVFERSLSFLAHHVKIPNIREEYVTFLKQISSKIEIQRETEHLNPAFAAILMNDVKLLRSIPGALFMKTILDFKETFGMSTNVENLLKITMIAAPTTASVERSFSYINSFKTDRRSSMMLPMVNARMRARTNGPSINMFNPYPSMERFFQSETRSARPVSLDERHNALTEIRREQHISYQNRKVILNPDDSDLQFVSTASVSQLPMTPRTTWYHRQQALRNL